MIAFIVGTLTFVLSAVLPVVVKPWLLRLGVMDVPNARSSHTKPVLRGLGLSVLIAIIAGLLCALLLGADVVFVSVVTLGIVAAGLLGLGEDVRGVSVAVRSVTLLGIGVSVSCLLIWIPGTWTSETPLVLQILLVVYAILFISSFINVANFMDGLNGISGFHGALAGLTFASAGALTGVSWLLVVGAVIAAGFLGFLPWNLSKPGAFLGDVGSYLLGGAIAVTSFAALVAGVPVLATIGPMICYFGDVGVTLVKRVRAGHKWDEPHKQHVYQRVQQMGYSHVAASGIVVAFSTVGSILGLLSCVLAPVWWIPLLIAGLALVVVYLKLPELLPSRHR